MKNSSLKKWLKKATTFLAITGIFISTVASTASALVTSTTGAPTIPTTTTTAITNVEMVEVSGNKNFMELTFCINTETNTTVGIAESTKAGNKAVKILIDNEKFAKDCYALYWYKADVDPKGNYYYWIQANDALKTDWIDLGEGTNTTPDDDDDDEEEDIISDLDVSPSKFDPYDDDEIEISFELNEDAEVDIKIYDDDDDLVITLEDNEDLDDGDHEFEWDGEDDDGDLVDDGEYYVKVKAKTDDGEKDIAKEDFKVKEGYDEETEEPRLRDVFVSKSSFDASRDEKTSIVFTTTADADVKVSLYDEDDDEVIRLYDKKNVDAGTYSIEWDGRNEKGNEVQEDKEYTYEIEIENSEGEDSETGKIEIEDDEQWTKIPNIYRDTASPVVFTPEDNNDKMKFTFKLSKDADVTILVYDNGYIKAHVYSGDLDEGTSTIKWDGEDDDGDLLSDGVYEYKIVAENYIGESKEWGKFMIEDSYKKNYTKKTAGYTDVYEGSEYADAIEWATDNDIFEGYDNGTFLPYQSINRAEALKSVFLALDIDVLDDNGSNLGYIDVVPGEWYMKYIRTGKAYGIVHGYADGTFKPEKKVTKAEALVMLINTAKVANGLIVPTCTAKPYADAYTGTWYSDAVCYDAYYDLTESGSNFYPNQVFTRGEMAKLLYNFYKEGLMD
jgi:flagellar hook assembly protein FlgD